MRSLQNYCAVIGIFEGQTLQHSIVYDYLQDDEYFATRDETAMINQNRLRVSRIEALSDAVVACADGAESSLLETRSMHRVQRVLNDAIKCVRVSGSLGIDVAQVARGRLDALVTPANPRDALFHCTSLLITQAGGFVTGIPLDSGTDSITVVANPRLNQTISAMIRTLTESNVQDPSPLPESLPIQLEAETKSDG